ncbi:unnamed protein product [Heligmosomoides polygyrus]|uniref:DUF1080 domain-containing protein n=1 Tax=Heligmosomoides polygyrus TaxID=6339 RepID=A0A3P7WLC7_HELPZ|nr:unnamed protein product [Heligmosomoides polygyrus]
MSWRLLVLLFAAACLSDARCKYRESRVREQVISMPRNCRVKLSQVGEEYWTSVGYDGLLRNGRTTADFLTLPQSGEGDIREGWVAYWITKSRYGDHHYEVFGHAYLRRDGRVCALFAGRDRDVIDICGGFRVLSRNRNNPSEDMPFEWIQAGYARPREALGFHHHRIAKYEWTPEDVFFGDAQLRNRVFHGVSPNSRFYMEMSTPDLFAGKVWVLRRKPEGGVPSAGIGAGVRPEWHAAVPHSGAQSAAIGGGVRSQEGDNLPSWTSTEARDQHRARPAASQEVRPESAAPASVSDRARPATRDQLRFRYVKPGAVIADQYGRLYESVVENGKTRYYVHSRTADQPTKRSQWPQAKKTELVVVKLNITKNCEIPELYLISGQSVIITINDNAVSEDLNGSAEISQYPARLPSPRALLPEEREPLDF